MAMGGYAGGVGGGGGDGGFKTGGDTGDVVGKIFVGGLSWNTTEDGLRYYFEKFGKVESVDLMIDKKTGTPRLVRLVLFVALLPSIHVPSQSLTAKLIDFFPHANNNKMDAQTTH